MIDSLSNIFCLSLAGGALGGCAAMFFIGLKIQASFETIKKLEQDVQTLKIQVAALHAQYYTPVNEYV
jgi:hypothetical protein